MRKCEKFGIKCPYCVKNNETNCVGTSQECELRRSRPLVFPADCSYEIPGNWKTWAEVYAVYMDSLPEMEEEGLFLEFKTGDFSKIRLFVPYIVMMTCNEAFEQILRDEVYQGMKMVKILCKNALKKALNVHASAIKRK